jgi:hypothetical protein
VNVAVPAMFKEYYFEQAMDASDISLEHPDLTFPDMLRFAHEHMTFFVDTAIRGVCVLFVYTIVVCV